MTIVYGVFADDGDKLLGIKSNAKDSLKAVDKLTKDSDYTKKYYFTPFEVDAPMVGDLVA